jgi:hypothetical protein
LLAERIALFAELVSRAAVRRIEQRCYLPRLQPAVAESYPLVARLRTAKEKPMACRVPKSKPTARNTHPSGINGNGSCRAMILGVQ